ncbi:IS66 family insertion sequence element accessory protein TnpB [Bradyrhizobium sp. 149]|nr:IS66 family insertion sequence element accessory protein TnpB [Bradyrhizobium sp. 149]
MILIAARSKIWIATGHTDMRKGMQGLALLVPEGAGRDPSAGDIFVSVVMPARSRRFGTTGSGCGSGYSQLSALARNSTPRSRQYFGLCIRSMPTANPLRIVPLFLNGSSKCSLKGSRVTIARIETRPVPKIKLGHRRWKQASTGQRVRASQ